MKKTAKSLAKSKTKASSKKTSVKKINTDWPLKRRVFFKPQRLKYVRKLEKIDGCVFCKSAQEEKSIETLCVFKSAYSQIILNKYPYNNGHLLVLPLEHNGDLLSLSPERYDDLQLTLRLAVAAVQEVYKPAGFNIGLNHGAAAGAGIPDHLHYHIVPRWSGDLNFFPLIAETKLVIETVEDSYQRFLNFFDNHSSNQS